MVNQGEVLIEPLDTKEKSSNSPKYRVLVVDDEPAHRMLEVDILEEVDCDVLEASSGAMALELLTQHPFDVVLLDKNLLDMDGNEVCQQIRETLGLKLLPVIMVTGCTSRQDFISSMAAGANDFIRKPYNPVELSARVLNFARFKEVTDKLESAETLLFTLARMVETRDGDTGEHCSRLSMMGLEFGKDFGLSDQEIEALRLGGVLHDLGKLGIPDSILLKPGPLNEGEWEVMRKHTIIGEQLLSCLKTMDHVRPIVKCHHERWDGSGYPQGLKGEAIPKVARVFQLLDIYDALASERPYKKPLPVEKIIAIFEEEIQKGWRDPILAKQFLDLIQNQPQRFNFEANEEEDKSTKLLKQITATGALSADLDICLNLKSLRNKNLTVVHSETSMAEFLAYQGEFLGMNSSCFNSNEAALNYLQGGQHNTEILLCQYSGLDVDGLSLIAHFRAIDPDILILMLMGKEETTAMLETEANTALLYTPFNSADLQAKLALLVGK